MSSLDDFFNEMIERQWLDVEDMPESWQELFPQAYHDRYDNAAYMAAYRALIDNDDMSEDEARHHMVMAQDEVIAILQGKERSFFLFNDAAEDWILSMVDVD